jgi:hypothetical protein
MTFLMQILVAPAGVVLARRGGIPPLWTALIVLLMVALAVYAVYASAKRRKELAAWAAVHGLSFYEGRACDLESKYPQFGCLQQGHSRYAHNLIEGQWDGRGMLGFDYHYVTGHGKNRHTHHFSAVILKSDVPLQPLYIRPENFLDKVTEFFGADDIDFESAEFSREFFVKAANKRWAYDVIHPRAMEFLLAGPRFHIQLGLLHAICWRGGLFKPADFEAACQVVAGLLDRLPEYVVRQQGELGRAGQGEA